MQLARRIRAREVQSAEVVAAHLRHMEEVNPRLNAVVVSRAEQALAEAEAADRRIAEGELKDLPPLWGVPCTIKESFDLSGMPQTGGKLGRWVMPERDAPTVRRLRQAGAIPLGVTNVSELLMWMESDNPVYGRCNNAYDPARIAETFETAVTWDQFPAFHAAIEAAAQRAFDAHCRGR